jgi:cation diffusion facilitator family transporter
MIKPSDIAAIRVAKITVAVSFFIFLVKMSAYAMTHSTSVLSDALESIVNVVAAIVGFFVLRAVAQPADKEHPYGHGKLEYFSAAFEGGLVTFAALVILIEAVSALFRDQALHEIDYGILLMASTTLLNFALGFYVRTVGKRIHSEALKASAQHLFSDVWTTVAVLVGLLLFKITKWYWIDPFIAILVALHLMYSGVKIVRSNIGGLIDEYEPEALNQLAEALTKMARPGFIDIHNLKVIRAGRFHHIDAHVVVPQFWDIEKAHFETEKFEQEVVSLYPYDGEIAFHIDPCEKKYCESCDLSDCPIRARKFEARRPFSVKHLIRGPADDSRLFHG